MSVELFERYMEALRRGHVALSRGHFEAALIAYREAADLATDRALPLAGIGNVHLQQGLPEQALSAFEAALARTGRDEAALDGRARALAQLGRRTEAAATLDILADVQEAAGRLTDACDTARRALALAEQKARRRHVQDLTRRLRLSGADLRAEEELSRALRLLEPDDAERGQPSAPEASPTPAGEERGMDRPAGPIEPESARSMPAGPAGTRRSGAPGEEVPAPPDVPAVTAPVPAPNPLELMALAEAAADAGRREAARAAYVRAAAAFQAEGLLAAALDACYFAISLAPADPQLHLRLVELYLALDWGSLAADKLALLGRLSLLDGHDRRTRSRIVSLAADHFPDDPRLRHLST